MRTGAILSGLLHLGLIAVALLGLPRWIKPEPLDQQVIPFEFIAEVAEQRSAPPEPPKAPVEVAKVAPPPPEPEPEPEPAKAPEPPPPKEIAKAEPEPPKPEPAPPKAATPAPRPAPAPRAKPKPPPKPKPTVVEKKPEPPKPEDFLSRMRKAVAKHEPPPVTPTPQPRLARADVPMTRLGNFAKRLTMSEEDAVRRHIMRCWNPPVGARDARDMEVRVIGKLRRDGLVQRVDVVNGDKARMRQDPFFRTFAESALRAFYKCGQLPLPADKYESWKTFNIGFNLKDMLGQ